MTTVREDLGTRELAAGLLAVMSPLRGALRRLARRGLAGAPLPTAQTELLRVVRLQPGIGVREAAQRLGVAPNTVSTLVNQLVAAGLVERGRNPDDRRAVRLELTEAARLRVATWRDQREQALADAIAELDADERRALALALPALRNTLDGLERWT